MPRPTARTTRPSTRCAGVRLLQLAAEAVLFGSLFYFALRSLGLVRGKRARNMFIAFLAGGGLLGIILPVIFDGSLRLAGIGWPAGLMLGLVLFVTVDLVFAGRISAGADEDFGEPRTQLLIVALFAAAVAHFVELHVGIAIVSTMTHFWTLAAMLVVVGLGWVREEEEAESAARVCSLRFRRWGRRRRLPEVSRQNARIPRPAAAPARSGKAAKAPVPATGQRRTDERGGGGVERGTRAAFAAASPAPVTRHPLFALLPYAFIMAIISAVFVWDYTTMQSGTTSGFGIFWKSFTTRVSGFQVVSSPMLLVLVLFTWLIGGITAIPEAREENRNRFSLISGALLYFGLAAAVFLVYGLIHGMRVDISGLDAMGVVQRVASLVVGFDIVLLLLGIGLAAGLVLARPLPWPARLGRRPAVSLAAGAALTGLAVFLIASINIKTIQADTYFKQGQGYEGVGQWEGSVLLYREAAQLQPKEDYYYLFLGRALLQLSDQEQPGTAVLPEDVSSVPTGELLDLVDRAVQARDREDFLRAAHGVLVGAQRLNPYNTDHSANLARLFRAWAFTGAVAPAESGDVNRLREVLQKTPDKVNQGRLQKSLDYYRDAVLLSPNNAGLRNELATVQYIQNDLAGARQTLEQSIQVDDRYYPTYLLLGDVLSAAGDGSGALAAYKKALEISPKNLSVLSAVGIAGSEAGDPEVAADAYQRVIDIQGAALKATQARLNQLNAEANAAGGYDRLLGNATGQRSSLEQQASQQQRQLFLAYRNLARGAARDGPGRRGAERRAASPGPGSGIRASGPRDADRRLAGERSNP